MMFRKLILVEREGLKRNHPLFQHLQNQKVIPMRSLILQKMIFQRHPKLLSCRIRSPI